MQPVDKEKANPHAKGAGPWKSAWAAQGKPDPKEVRGFIRRAPWTMGVGLFGILLVFGLGWKLALGFAFLMGVAQWMYGKAKLRVL